MFQKLKHLVEQFPQITTEFKAESLTEVQTQFKIGLALCISKNSKWLSEVNVSEINEWLNEQIEMYGEQSNFETETINVKEVCLMVGHMIRSER